MTNNNNNTESPSQKEVVDSPEQKEGEGMKEMRIFFEETMPWMNADMGDNKRLSSLFEEYLEYMNNEPTFENFWKIYTSGTIDGTPEKNEALKDELIRDAWIQYLENKLPPGQAENIAKAHGEENVYGLDPGVLEEIHKKRIISGDNTILGIHTSPKKIMGEVKPSTEGTSIVADGKQHEIPAGHSFYSTSPQHLYKHMGGYITLVAGNQKQLAQNREKYNGAHGRGNHVAVAGPIKTLSPPFKLDDEMIKALNLKLYN